MTPSSLEAQLMLVASVLERDYRARFEQDHSPELAPALDRDYHVWSARVRRIARQVGRLEAAAHGEQAGLIFFNASSEMR